MSERTIEGGRRRDDAYVALPEQGVDWVERNRGGLLVGAAVLVVLLVVGVVWGVIYSNRSAKASAAFGAAMQTYQTPLASPGQQVPPGLKTFPSGTERARQAAAEFLAVANQYGMTPDGKNARYFAGLSYMEAGQTASAESTLKQVASGWDRPLSSLAKLAMAQLYRGNGQMAQAEQMYGELIKKPTTAVPSGLAQLQLASLYTVEGKPDQARRIYAELKDKDAKGPAGMIAAQKLNPGAGAAAAPQM